MKKSILAVSILLLLSGGVAIAYGLDRFSSAAEARERIERSIAKIDTAKNMAEAEGESDWVKLDAEQMGKAKQSGMIGVGGGVVLLGAAVVAFLKARNKAA